MIRVGELAVLLELRSTDSVLAALDALTRGSPRGVRDLVPGATTLLATFDAIPSAEQQARLASVEATSLQRSGVAARSRQREHRIPVRYDGEDLRSLARLLGLCVEDVVRLHCAAEYLVAFVGFQPGFAYLAGLPPALHAPRRAMPRPLVPAGSVAIGGEWTGIYPSATPGGWHLVGRTTLALFDPQAAAPALLAPGDRVRMVPCSDP